MESFRGKRSGISIPENLKNFLILVIFQHVRSIGSPIINLALAVIIQASKFDFDDCKSHYFCFTGKVINWVSIYD
ncbi:hypothetical protein L2E82_18082 [Cichorium intybus]|uniref:Uncharacterized protein n=1 Tax=Cichorium intybus TaxID=13427 RepID=A0ACB9F9D4_CICIN|nr:hypothetical protein L2E82_18082 [Cichorium intybus]